MPSPPRRTFTKAAASAAVLTAAGYSRVLGANDKVRTGFIGVGNRGDQLLDAFLTHKDQQTVALCDVYEPYLPAAAAKVGASFEVECRGERMPAEVVSRPFWKKGSAKKKAE